MQKTRIKTNASWNTVGLIYTWQALAESKPAYELGGRHWERHLTLQFFIFMKGLNYMILEVPPIPKLVTPIK